MNKAKCQPLSFDGIESRPTRKPLFHFWRCFWLTFLVISLAYAWYSFYVPSNEIVWADNYALAQRQAADSGKPIILYFTGTWCVPCRIMKRQVWADEGVTALVNAQFIPVSIDVDNPSHTEIMARYKIGGPPVTIVTDPRGNVIDWRAGSISKSEFLELLDSSSPSDARGRVMQSTRSGLTARSWRATIGSRTHSPGIENFPWPMQRKRRLTLTFNIASVNPRYMPPSGSDTRAGHV